MRRNKFILCLLSSLGYIAPLYVNLLVVGFNAQIPLYNAGTRTLPPISPPNKKISITTLEKYCNEKKIEKIDFLKIDTEGYELEVLKGLKKKISSVNLILFEHHFDKG